MPDKPQKCYGGVYYLDGAGPDLDNVDRLDRGAWPMINRMMRTGLQVDLSHFAKMEKELARDKEEITERVHNITGYYCNLDSPDQVSKLLFKNLGIKQIRPKFTKSGDRESVEYEVLVSIQHDHECVPHIMAFKEVSKLLGTYVRPMPGLAKRSKFGVCRIYPNFGTTTIPSSRLNCKDPNLLAMPNRTKRGRQICEGFITDPGWVYLSVDFSQIEPRIITHRSGDKQLHRIYRNKEDIYSDFAISAFRLPDKRYKDDTGKWKYPGVDKKKHRFPSKTCVLAWFYKVTAPGLSEQMPVVCANCEKDATEHDCGHFDALWTEDPCQKLINSAISTYPDVPIMWARDERTAKSNSYIWDDWGRILHTMAVRSAHPWKVSEALRELGNFPIQSTAQGPVKLTMAEVEDIFVDAGIYGDVYNPLLQIHDEILGECREDCAEEIGAEIIKVMENSVKLRVPLIAEYATAESWGRLEK